jgi:hypothetical protein
MASEVVLRKMSAGISAGGADIESAEPLRALEYLQSIYRDPLQPAPVRMRAATIAIQYESPRLAVTGYIRDDASFAEALERALMRSSAAMRVIEHQPADGNGEG